MLMLVKFLQTVLILKKQRNFNIVIQWLVKMKIDSIQMLDVGLNEAANIKILRPLPSAQR